MKIFSHLLDQLYAGRTVPPAGNKVISIKNFETKNFGGLENSTGEAMDMDVSKFVREIKRGFIVEMT